MAVQTFQYFKDRFVTGYVVTEQDWTDVVDTMETLQNAATPLAFTGNFTANGGATNVVVSNGLITDVQEST